MTIDIVQLR